MRPALLFDLQPFALAADSARTVDRAPISSHIHEEEPKGHHCRDLKGVSRFWSGILFVKGVACDLCGCQRLNISALDCMLRCIRDMQ